MSWVPSAAIRKRRQRARGTTDARPICNDLERIINTPAFQNFKHPVLRSLDKTAVRIFFGGVPAEQPAMDIPLMTDYVEPFDHLKISCHFDDIVHRLVTPEDLQKLHAH